MLKKRLNFRVFLEIPSQFSDKPCDSDSKNNENSGQGRLQFSHSFKKAPPPFFKSWLRAYILQYIALFKY